MAEQHCIQGIHIYKFIKGQGGFNFQKKKL